MVGHAANNFVALGNHGNNFSATRFHFLYVRYNFIIMTPAWSNHHHGHFFVNKRNRTMFHLGSRISFCMDV